MSRLTDEGQLPDIQHLATNVIHVVDTTDPTDDASGSSFKTTWQKAKDLFFGLQFWTEARSIAAPNATIPAHSLTATGTETDIDAVISPKGTGGILAQVPDNTTTGGNKRGTNAVDLQMTRANANEVASGAQSGVLYGVNNKATFANSVAGGSGSSATNTGAIAIGTTCSASGLQAVSIGNNCSASNTSAIAIGISCQATDVGAVSLGINNVGGGRASMVMGEQCAAPEDHSMSIGLCASTFATRGRQSWATGKFVSDGDVQKSGYVFSLNTTDATQSTLVIDPITSTTPTAINQIILEDDQAVRITGKLLGKEQGSTALCAWDVDLILARGTGVASTVLTYNNIQVVSNIPVWGIPVAAADTTLGGLQFDVVGLAATDILWNFVIDSVDLIYA